jgi:hypothetical protein
MDLHRMEERARKAVTLGAQILQNRRPKWFRSVDLDSLRMNDVKHCVLAQVFGDYQKGLSRLGLHEYDAPDYGYALPKEYMRWDVLEAAWKEKVRELRKEAATRVTA